MIFLVALSGEIIFSHIAVEHSTVMGLSVGEIPLTGDVDKAAANNYRKIGSI